MDDTRWLDDLEMRAWRALLSAHSGLMARLDHELVARHGLSLHEYEVLAFLSEAPAGRQRMSTLAQEARISPSALTRRLDRLTQRGWVERLPCPSDARGTFAALTAEGRRRLVEAAPTHVGGVRAHLIDRLSRDELAVLGQALGRIASPVAAGAAGQLDSNP